MNSERFLVTGAMGCIGTWVLRNLIDKNVDIIAADRSEFQGATVCNLRGHVVEVAEFVECLRSLNPHSKVTFERDAPLPYPAYLDDSGLQRVLGEVPHTPLETAIRLDVGRYSSLLEEDRVSLQQLDA